MKSSPACYISIVVLTLSAMLNAFASGHESVDSIQYKMMQYYLYQQSCSYSMTTTVNDESGYMIFWDSFFVYMEPPYYYISAPTFSRYLSGDHDLYINNENKTLKIGKPGTTSLEAQQEEFLENITKFFTSVKELEKVEISEQERRYLFSCQTYPYQSILLILNRDYGMLKMQINPYPESGAGQITTRMLNWKTYEASFLNNFLSGLVRRSTRGDWMAGHCCEGYKVINEISNP